MKKIGFGSFLLFVAIMGGIAISGCKKDTVDTKVITDQQKQAVVDNANATKEAIESAEKRLKENKYERF